MLSSILAVCGGACAGALLRWTFNQALNSLFPALPPGTLAANLLGGFLMGMALGFFAFYPAISAQWRLCAVTGFLGSLTTFSAFSGEIAALVLQGRYVLCACGIGLHVIGSISMVFLGLAAFSLLKNCLP